MAGPKLDGAGTAKLKTLDDAMLLLQRINGLVENYANVTRTYVKTGVVEVKNFKTKKKIKLKKGQSYYAWK